MNTWRRRAPWTCWLLVIVLSLSSMTCKGKSGTDKNGVPFAVRDDSAGLLLTWIDEHGDFNVAQSPSEVPESARSAVRVLDPERSDGTHRERIFVADLRAKGADGTYPVSVSTLDEFEKLAVLRRTKTGPTLSPTSTAPRPEATAPDEPGQPQPNSPPSVIIYGAEWCGPCHQAASFLKRRNVAFVEKDIEKDPEAQKEMRQKLNRAGLRGGSIPVLDVRGRILVGYSQSQVEEALGAKL